MYKPLDTRQIQYRQILQHLYPYISGQMLDTLLQSIDSDLTYPMEVTATNPTSLTIDVGSSIITNPLSNRARSFPFISGSALNFPSGTVTFPSTDGGSITTSTGGIEVLSLPSNDYAQVILFIDQLGNLTTQAGTPSPSNPVVPTPSGAGSAFAYVTLFNNSGTIQNVSQSNIYQIEGGGGGGSTSKAATIQIFATPGGYTYTTPADCLYLKVTCVGGGGGGAYAYEQGPTPPSPPDGHNGTGSVFGGSLITANGGHGGLFSDPSGPYQSVGGTGGTTSWVGGFGYAPPLVINAGTPGIVSLVCRVDGQPGAATDVGKHVDFQQVGGAGGNTPFLGGGGMPVNVQAFAGFTGGDARPNSGGGGAGGGTIASGPATGGPGGGSGGYIQALFSNLASSYSITIGSGGAGANGPSNGFGGGGAGAAGIIIVEEFYS